MAGTGIEAAGLRGAMRMTWGCDHLAHVMQRCGDEEPPGAWTGLACPDHDLALGGEVDNAALRRLAAGGEIADLLWEAPGDLAAEHGELVQAAIRAECEGRPEAGELLRQQVQAIWAQAWSANYAALKLLQNAGLARFSPVKPQRWVVASFEHHRGPHGLSRPHIHNIVIAALTTSPLPCERPGKVRPRMRFNTLPRPGGPLRAHGMPGPARPARLGSRWIRASRSIGCTMIPRIRH